MFGDDSSNRAQAFIDGALSMGGKVLVHCGDGISRSPAIVYVDLFSASQLCLDCADGLERCDRTVPLTS